MALLRSKQSGQQLVDLKPGRYRDSKGNEYLVISNARHSETQEEMVIYRQAFGDRGLWVGPKALFFETGGVSGRKVPRFTFVGPY